MYKPDRQIFKWPSSLKKKIRAFRKRCMRPALSDEAYTEMHPGYNGEKPVVEDVLDGEFQDDSCRHACNLRPTGNDFMEPVIGERIWRDFLDPVSGDARRYEGIVASVHFDATETNRTTKGVFLYEVLYDDGDREDMAEEDMQQCCLRMAGIECADTIANMMMEHQGQQIPKQKFQLGTKIRKDFHDPDNGDMRTYTGEITDFRCCVVQGGSSQFLYRISYVDGDHEDLSEEEVSKNCHIAPTMDATA